MLPKADTVIKMRRCESNEVWQEDRRISMLPRVELEEVEREIAQRHYEWCIADTLANPSLTDEQKQELLRQLELPDDEWEPIKLPEDAEPMSVTIIKMRRGEA